MVNHITMPTASHLITKFSDFTTDAIHFGSAKANSRGGKNVPLFDKNGNKLVLALPKPDSCMTRESCYAWWQLSQLYHAHDWVSQIRMMSWVLRLRNQCRKIQLLSHQKQALAMGDRLPH